MPCIEATAPYAWPLSGTWSRADTALIVIDMQRDFLSEEGYFASIGEDIGHVRRTINPALRVLRAAREAGLTIVHTRECYSPDLSDVGPNKLAKSRLAGAEIGGPGPLGRFLVRGEYGSDFHDGFAARVGEAVIDKAANSAFYGTALEDILRRAAITHLLMMGVTTDVCVSSTMRDANERGFDCLLIEDCCGAATETLHQGVLRTLDHEGGIFGAYGPSGAVLEALEAMHS